MIFSPMTNVNSATPFTRKRNLPTPPPSLSDVNDSSSSSSSCSSSYSLPSSSPDSQSSVASCDLFNLLGDARFRPVFQAIEEIKRRKCRPDLERILKYVEKRSLANHFSYQREEILLMLDELLKTGLISKVFHKGGFTIRIKNEKLIDSSPSTSTVSHESISTVDPHRRETPSPEFADCSSTIISNQCHLPSKENRKRHRTCPSASSSSNKRSRLDKSTTIETTTTTVFRKPFLNTNSNLPPVTIEQLLGLRGDIPDVHNWTTDDLIRFFHQQGYEYASFLLSQHQINGNQLYELQREQVFRLSTLKIGKFLKLWNVIEQIQRNNPLSTSK